MRVNIFVYIMIISTFIFIIGCDDSSLNSTIDTTTLLLDYPEGGEIFTMGDTITISFRANGDSISNAEVSVSTNNRTNFFNITSLPVQITESGAHVYTQQWIIGREDKFDTAHLYRDTILSNEEDPAWKGNIKIESSGNKFVISEDFTIFFKPPYFIRYPIGGDTYNYTDSIPVLYTAILRPDVLAIIHFYWSVEVENWCQFTTRKTLTTPRGETIVTLKHHFIPSSPQNIDPVGDSTRILVTQYPSRESVKTGWIKINKE